MSRYYHFPDVDLHLNLANIRAQLISKLFYNGWNANKMIVRCVSVLLYILLRKVPRWNSILSTVFCTMKIKINAKQFEYKDIKQNPSTLTW